MQRSYPLRWLALAIGLLGTQCLDSISDDCTKTLTCAEQPPPRLGPDCIWRFPDGRVWMDGPEYDTSTGRWRWPDGKETVTQDITCNLNQDAGVDASGPDCRLGIACDAPLVCDDTTGACVECVADVECSGNVPVGDAGAANVCDTVRNDCVRCLDNSHCGGDTPVCKVDPTSSSNNQCVECTGAANCGGAEPVCDETTNECTTACVTTAECSGSDKPVCARGLCVECVDATTCTTTGNTQCNITDNQCVECIDDGPCSGTGEVCDTTLHACVQCREDIQCQNGPNAATAPFCDPESKTCVPCLTDSQCTSTSNSRCNPVSHVCTGCTDNSQCEGGLLCRSGSCVECLDSTQCTGTTRPFCETVSGSCVECLDSDSCLAQDAAHCATDQTSNPRFVCDGCESNGDCAGKPGLGGLCSTANGLCVFCLTEAECSGDPSQSRCVPTGPERGTCTVCEGDEDCRLFNGAGSNPLLLSCKTGEGCVECVDNVDCTGNADGAVCKTSNAGQAAGGADINTCVECTANTNCTAAGASRCSGNECAQCAADGDCSHIPGLNVCDGGTCVQCAGAKRAACGLNVCDSLNRVCAVGRGVDSAGLCDDCVSDLECDPSARCVQLAFGGADQGFFCLPLEANGSCARTYALGAPLATIDGEQPTPTMCRPRLTTCEGLRDYEASEPCDSDAECGAAGVADGLCDDGVCNIPCAVGLDCLVACTAQGDVNACTVSN